MIKGMSEGMKKWIIREQPRDPYAMAELMQVYLCQRRHERVQLPNELKIIDSSKAGTLLGVEGAIIRNDGIIQYLGDTKARRRGWLKGTLERT